MAVNTAQIISLMQTLSKVDWASATQAVASGMSDRQADEALAENAFEIIAPILAPYIAAEIGLAAIPGLGLLVPLLAPAIGFAILNFQGGDQNPEHDANEYQSARDDALKLEMVHP